MTKLGRTSETTSTENEIEDLASQPATEHKDHVDTKASFKNSGSSTDSRTFGTRTEKVINSFLENPILKQRDTTAEEHQVTVLVTKCFTLSALISESHC